MTTLTPPLIALSEMACAITLNSTYRNDGNLRRAHNLSYGSIHRDEKKAKDKAWRIANNDAINQRASARRKINGEKIKLRCKLYYEKNKAMITPKKAAYRALHKQQSALALINWKKANPERYAEIARNRKARKQLAQGSHTVSDIQRIRSAQGNKCAYCGVRLVNKGHLDHITPLARGGTNWPRNLQWLCAPCNLSKNSKDPIEFAQLRGMLL